MLYNDVNKLTLKGMYIMLGIKIIINKLNGEKIIFEEKEELEKHFNSLFKEVYDNPDNYDDVERDSAHEIVSFMDKKKFNEEQFIELLNNEKSNLNYFWFGYDNIEVGNVKVDLKD